jgi:uncharacterized membrane protein YgcG
VPHPSVNGSHIAIKSIAISLWLCLVALAAVAHAQAVQPVPALVAHVIDATGTLQAGQQAALEAKLAALESTKGSQVVVLMVPTTAPEDIASYANRVGNTWKIGRKDVGDGVLLVVAKDDRKLRIEVAKALEGAIPDLAAKQIIDEALTPRFKAGDYAGGLDAAVDQLAARIKGEPLPSVTRADSAGSDPRGDGFQWWDLAIFLFVAVPVVRRGRQADFRARPGFAADRRRGRRGGAAGDVQRGSRRRGGPGGHAVHPAGLTSHWRTQLGGLGRRRGWLEQRRRRRRRWIQFGRWWRLRRRRSQW